MSSVELNNASALSKQDLSKLDVSKLTALSPEVISRQATINIGTIGHVAHGKSTVVKAVSGVQTVRFKNELERNITIKLESESAGPELEQPTGSTAELNGSAMLKRKAQDTGGDDAPKKKRARQEKDPKEQVYEVELVLDHKIFRSKHTYFVKWKDWPDESNTWEPPDHLDGCHEALFTFLNDLTKDKDYSEQNFVALRHQLYHYEHSDLENILKEYVTPKGIVIPPPEYEEIDEKIKILSMWPKAERDPKVVQMVRHYVLEAKLYEARQNQLDCLKDWEDEMNNIIKRSNSSSISVTNNVDLEGPPENFIYINDYLPGEGVDIPEDPPVGCDCEPICSSFKRRCCPTSTGSSFAYDKDGKVKVACGTPIYECNSRCKCGIECVNRVVQKGRTMRLGIFRTSTGCGWGVRALEEIPKGSFVSEYVGEVITFDEAEKRGKQYDKEGQTYLFDLDFNDTNAYPFTVDAAVYGNISHFVNHSCDPNMAVYAVYGECLDPNLPKLALFARRDIKPGDEVSFDYLNQSKLKRTQKEENAGLKVKLNGMVNKKNSNSNHSTCKCGSKRCRKYYL